MEEKLPFPTIVPFDKPIVEKRYYRCLQTNHQEPSFHFSIVLLKDWRPVDIPLETPQPDNPSVVGLFRSLGEPRAEVEVTSVLITREIAPADWLMIFLETTGHTILNSRITQSKGGNVADVLSRQNGEQGQVISRWLALKDYNHLFLIQARCLENQYQTHAANFFMAIAGFQLSHPSDWPLAEKLKTFSRREPGDFCIFYPESWELEPDPNAHENALSLQLIQTASDSVVGTITVAAIARSVENDPQNIADQYINEIRNNGKQVPQVSILPAETIEAFNAVWQGSIQTSLDNTQAHIEIQITIGQCTDAWFLVALLGPSRKTTADIWAINKRAYEIIFDWFRTPLKIEREKGMVS